MKSIEDETFSKIWWQTSIPVIAWWKRTEPINVKLPYERDNRIWLKKKAHNKQPAWVEERKCWKLPKSRFEELAEMCLRQYKQIYIIQFRNELEKCAPACMNATGFDCECSCNGKNHGLNHLNSSWFVLSESCAFRFKDHGCTYRLIKTKEVSTNTLA